jgi:hypothetical protein
MASYTQFLGRIVTVQYRAGDMVLSAYGSFVGDSGRSIFLEQHVEQRGKRSYFRWEIPYQCIHRIKTESEAEEALASAADSRSEMSGNRGPIRLRRQLRLPLFTTFQDSLKNARRPTSVPRISYNLFHAIASKT